MFRSLVWFAIATIPLQLPLASVQGQEVRQQTTLTLDVVGEFSQDNPPANIAITPDGRRLMSLHPFFGSKYRVVEVLKDGSTRPFPNEAWATAPNAQGIGLHKVLGIQADQNGIVWMLEDSPGNGQAGRVIGWNTHSNTLAKIIYIAAPLVHPDTFLNDLAVDTQHHKLYITDTAGGKNSALLVVDLQTGAVRRVLEGHLSTRPEEIDMVVSGRVMKVGGKNARIGANPITIDSQNEWVYYGPMTGRSLYRIRACDLANIKLSPSELATKVERYSDKPLSDGITIDNAGNIYVTDFTRDAVGVIKPDRSYQILYQDAKFLSWPDGLSIGPDHQVYVTTSQLQYSPALNNGKNEAVNPFYLLKFPALAEGTVGR